MATGDFVIDLFCRMDDRMKNLPKHSRAALWPSEPATVGRQASYRWPRRGHARWFPRSQERTRLFHRLEAHWRLARMFLAEAEPARLEALPPRVPEQPDAGGDGLLHARRRLPRQENIRRTTRRRVICGSHGAMRA